LCIAFHLPRMPVGAASYMNMNIQHLLF
jgi:hypothetical protein